MCGLKYKITLLFKSVDKVTPHVGVWIEIEILGHSKPSTTVTPHVGVWIEIVSVLDLDLSPPSHLT